MKNLVTPKQQRKTNDVKHDWVIDSRGTRVGKMSRGHKFMHAFVALLVLAGGYYSCDFALSLGIFSTGKAGLPSSHVEGQLLAVFDQLQSEPYDELVKKQTASRRLTMDDPALKYRLDLKFKPSGVNLLLIEGVIVDHRTGKELDRLQTYRAKKE